METLQQHLTYVLQSRLGTVERGVLLDGSELLNQVHC